MKIVITLFCLLMTSSLFAKVDRKTFEELGDKVISLYQREADAEGVTVFNTPDWSDKNINGTVMWVRNYPYVELRYPGALAKSALTVDGLSLILCHELGHLFGKKIDGDRTAPEGEADYFATADCLKKLWREKSGNRYVQRVTVAALESAKVMFDAPVSIAKKDNSKVRETLTDYPSDQCRLDTYLAGAQGQARPRCWSK